MTAIHSKFPQGSANCNYDIFEEFPDGSTLWRKCVIGIGTAEIELGNLSKRTSNKLFALSLSNLELPKINARAAAEGKE